MHRTSAAQRTRDIAIAYAEGAKLVDICKRFDCSVSAIYQATRGMPRRLVYKLPPRTMAKIRRFTAIGLGYRHIATLLGLSPGRTRALVREAREKFPSGMTRLRKENARLREENEGLRAALEAAGVA